MKFLIFILILISFHQASACDFNQYSGDIRLSIINGDQIYTLFTPHITQEHVNAVMSVTRTRDGINRLNDTLDTYKTTIESEQSDVRQIIRLLESQQIDWMGIEASPGELQNTPFNKMVSNYRKERIALNRLSFHPRWNPDKTDKTLYLLFSTYIIAYVQNPESFHGIRIVPLENNEQKEKASELDLQIRQQRDTLIHFIHTGLMTGTQFQTIETFFTDRLNHVIESNSSSEIESLLANLQEDVRAAVNTYLSLINEFVHLKEERSQTMAETISQQSGNGLVIAGYSHASSIEEYLTDTCKNTQIQ